MVIVTGAALEASSQRGQGAALHRRPRRKELFGPNVSCAVAEKSWSERSHLASELSIPLHPVLSDVISGQDHSFDFQTQTAKPPPPSS